LSIITKIFVVLVTFLSVLLVAIIVPFVARVEDYREVARQEQDRRLLAEKTARLRQAEISVLQDRESERVKDLRSQITTLTSQIASLTEELASTRANLQEAKGENAKREADRSSLIAANRQFAATVESLHEELKQRREQNVDQTTKMIQLADRNNELESQLDSLTRQVRRLKEQLTAVQSRSEELQTAFERLDPAIRRDIMGGGQEATAAATTPFESAVPITGRVTNVQKIADETFVEINIGRNDGVAENMKFLVHRGGQYLGTMVIDKVDTSASAGHMRLIKEGQQITGGDAVMSGTGVAGGT
jgi:chromosome segregation ATPase